MDDSPVAQPGVSQVLVAQVSFCSPGAISIQFSTNVNKTEYSNKTRKGRKQCPRRNFRTHIEPNGSCC